MAGVLRRPILRIGCKIEVNRSQRDKLKATGFEGFTSGTPGHIILSPDWDDMRIPCSTDVQAEK